MVDADDLQSFIRAKPTLGGRDKITYRREDFFLRELQGLEVLH